MYEYANEIGIKIELENPAYEINYLDLNLNLRNGAFHQYRKPNNEIKYIDVSSNKENTKYDWKKGQKMLK